jgi:DNA-binding response OmpR family regulator
MRILLIEDDQSTQRLLQSALSATGNELLGASSGKEAISVLTEKDVHLILLDMGLPDVDGLALCAQLQSNPKWKNIPVMILTARVDVSAKVAAFSLGVEDYISKPCDLLELRARVEARLRKIQKSTEEGEILTKGELRLSVAMQKAYRLNGDSEIDLELTPIEFKLLLQLAKREGRVLQRDQILDLVWGQNSEVLDRTVDAHISVLRKKLGSLSSIIQSVPGQGYLFSIKSEK